MYPLENQQGSVSPTPISTMKLSLTAGEQEPHNTFSHKRLLRRQLACQRLSRAKKAVPMPQAAMVSNMAQLACSIRLVCHRSSVAAVYYDNNPDPNAKPKHSLRSTATVASFSLTVDTESRGC